MARSRSGLSFAPALEKRIQALLQAGKGMLAVAKDVGVGSGTVQRVAREMRRGAMRSYG